MGGLWSVRVFVNRKSRAFVVVSGLFFILSLPFFSVLLMTNVLKFTRCRSPTRDLFTAFITRRGLSIHKSEDVPVLYNARVSTAI